MKVSEFSDAQKAFILKQAEGGVQVAEICRKAGISLTIARSPVHDLPSVAASTNLQTQLIQCSPKAEHRRLTQTQQPP